MEVEGSIDNDTPAAVAAAARHFGHSYRHTAALGVVVREAEVMPVVTATEVDFVTEGVVVAGGRAQVVVDMERRHAFVGEDTQAFGSMEASYMGGKASLTRLDRRT